MTAGALPMNISQKRFFTLLQMLEGIQATMAAMQADMKVLAETTEQTEEIVQVLNVRLLCAGHALLGRTTMGFKKEFQEKYNYGYKFPE
jgi:hypothetical protein